MHFLKYLNFYGSKAKFEYSKIIRLLELAFFVEMVKAIVIDLKIVFRHLHLQIFKTWALHLLYLQVNFDFPLNKSRYI